MPQSCTHHNARRRPQHMQAVQGWSTNMPCSAASHLCGDLHAVEVGQINHSMAALSQDHHAALLIRDKLHEAERWHGGKQARERSLPLASKSVWLRSKPKCISEVGKQGAGHAVDWQAGSTRVDTSRQKPHTTMNTLQGGRPCAPLTSSSSGCMHSEWVGNWKETSSAGLHVCPRSPCCSRRWDQSAPGRRRKGMERWEHVARSSAARRSALLFSELPCCLCCGTNTT